MKEKYWRGLVGGAVFLTGVSSFMLVFGGRREEYNPPPCPVRQERIVSSVRTPGFDDMESYYGQQTRNVLRGEEPETFVEISGIRYYYRIDGKCIDDLVIERGKK